MKPLLCLLRLCLPLCAEDVKCLRVIDGEPELVTIRRRCPQCRSVSSVQVRKGQPWICIYCVALFLVRNERRD